MSFASEVTSTSLSYPSTSAIVTSAFIPNVATAGTAIVAPLRAL